MLGTYNLNFLTEEQTAQPAEAQPTTGTADPKADKKEPKKPRKMPNALACLTGRKKIDENNDLNDDQKNFLRKLNYADAGDGDIGIYTGHKNEGDDPDVIVRGNGAVGIKKSIAPDSDEGIDAYLKGAEVFRTMNPGGAVVVGGSSSTESMMAAYAAKLAGLDVKNDPPVKDLSKENPELAEKMSKKWAEMGGNKLNPPQEAFKPAAPAATPAPTDNPPGVITSGGKRLNEWGEILPESRSGLESPVKGGLRCEFGSCAERAAPTDARVDPAPDPGQKTQFAKTEVKANAQTFGA